MFYLYKMPLHPKPFQNTAVMIITPYVTKMYMRLESEF